MRNKPTRFMAMVLAPTAILAALIYAWQYLAPRESAARPVLDTEEMIADVSQAPADATLRPLVTLEAAGSVGEASKAAVSGDWLLLISGRARRVLLVKTTTNMVFDVSDEIMLRIGSVYSYLVSGPRDGMFIVASSKELPVLAIAVDGDHTPNITFTEVHRGPNWDYSFQLRQGEWLSTASMRGAGLYRGSLVNGALVHEPLDRERLLFPDVDLPLASLMLNKSVVAVAPDRTRAAQAFLLSCRVHIISAAGTTERQIAAPIDIKLDYELYFDERDGQSKMRPSPGMKYCYTQATATRDGVIALFAGQSMKSRKQAMGEGRQLHYFSWDGELKAIWQLEIPVDSIAAAPAADRLWAVTATGNSLVEFALPQS